MSVRSFESDESDDVGGVQNFDFMDEFDDVGAMVEEADRMAAAGQVGAEYYDDIESDEELLDDEETGVELRESARVVIAQLLGSEDEIKISMFRSVFKNAVEIHFGRRHEQKARNWLLNLARRSFNLPEVENYRDEAMPGTVQQNGTVAANQNRGRLCACPEPDVVDDGTFETCRVCGTSRDSASASTITFEDVMTSSEQGNNFTMINGRKIYHKGDHGIVGILERTRAMIYDFPLLADVEGEDSVRDTVSEFMRSRVYTSGRMIRMSALKTIIRRFPGKFEDRYNVLQGALYFRLTRKSFPEIFAYAAGMGSEMHKAFMRSPEAAVWWSDAHVDRYRAVFDKIKRSQATVGPLAMSGEYPGHDLMAGIVYHVVQELKTSRKGQKLLDLQDFFDVAKDRMVQVRNAIKSGNLDPAIKRKRRW